jgi:hypothetical protein
MICWLRSFFCALRQKSSLSCSLISAVALMIRLGTRKAHIFAVGDILLLIGAKALMIRLGTRKVHIFAVGDILLLIDSIALMIRLGTRKAHIFAEGAILNKLTKQSDYYRYDLKSLPLVDLRRRESALSLIWRTRSLVKSNLSPISSSVSGLLPSKPK